MFQGPCWEYFNILSTGQLLTTQFGSHNSLEDLIIIDTSEFKHLTAKVYIKIFLRSEQKWSKQAHQTFFDTTKNQKTLGPKSFRYIGFMETFNI